MTTLATLVVRIQADTTDYQTKLKAVAEMGKKISDVGGKLTKAVTLPLVAIGAASVMAASNLNESMSKVQVVFGKTSKSIVDFAKTADKNLGLSQRAALEAAGTFGNLFVTMGLGQDDAAGMSKELVKLSSDLASFNNLGTEEVLLKIRSGLVGETEPLRALGVNLTAAGVQAKAMEMGLADAAGQVSQSGMVQARYALILEQTTTAQGDFARTADGMANKLRTAKAQIENSAAALGEKLLPYAIQAVDWVTKLVTAFSNLPKPTQDAAIAIAAVAAASGPVLTVFGNLLKIGPGLITFLGSIGPLGWVVAAGIGVAVVAVKNLNDQVEKGISDVDQAWKDYFARQVAQGKSSAQIAEDYAKREAEVNKIWNERGDLGEEIGKAYVRQTQDESKFMSNQPLLQQTLLQTSHSFEEYWNAISGGDQSWLAKTPIEDIAKAQAKATWDAAKGTTALADAEADLAKTGIPLENTLKKIELDTLSLTDAYGLLTQAGTDLGLADEELTNLQLIMQESVGGLRDELNTTTTDMQLLAQATALGIYSTTQYGLAMHDAAAGTLDLSNAERASIQASVDAARAQREKALAVQAASQSYLDLASSLKGATNAQIAETAIQGLSQMQQEGKIDFSTYFTAVSGLQESFGLSDQKSRALANAMPILNDALASGVLPASSYDEALKAVVKDSGDGVVNMDAIINKLGVMPDSMTGAIDAFGNLAQQLGDVPNAAALSATQTYNAFATPNWAGAGTDAGAKIAQGITTATPVIVAAAQAAVQAAINAAAAAGATGPTATPAVPPPAAPGYAEGGSGVVPPGYSNDSYLVGLSSGETFTVTPPGASGGETVINVPIVIYGNADPEKVKIAARDGVLAAQRASGKR